MNISKISSFPIFCHLVKTHLAAVRGQLFDMVLNLYVWVFCSLIIMGYVMQSFGLTSTYGNFLFASLVGTIGFFEIYGNVSRNVMDFDGDRIISYYLTLPTTPFVVFASYVCYYVLIVIFLGVMLLPFGALVLYNTFTFANTSWPQLAGIFLLGNIFIGILTLMLSAYVGTMARIRNVWSRFIFPLWMSGCYQFSWAVVYKLSALFAYALLCNQMVFIMEGTRASLLGQGGFLSWYVCCGALVGFIIACWLHMYYKMQRLLDFV